MIKDLTNNKTNYQIQTKKVSLEDIFPGITAFAKILEDNKRKNKKTKIKKSMTINQKIEEALYGIQPSEQIIILDKYLMKLRKANSIRVTQDAAQKRSKYPRIIPDSKNYK